MFNNIVLARERSDRATAKEGKPRRVYPLFSVSLYAEKAVLFGGLSVSFIRLLFDYAPIEQEQFPPLLFRREPLPFSVLAFEYAHRNII